MIFTNRLDTVLDDIRRRWGIPGLGVGIVGGDEVIYTRCLGVQSLETLAPVTPDTVFCLQSISKCFVSSAVMQLVEQDKIRLDAPLIEYLPYFRLDDERFPQITIRQVLSHTSGLPDIDELEYTDLMAHPEVDEGAAERFVRRLSSLKLILNPGERFIYSNIGYNLLGDLIAKISGHTFEDYMQEHILLPAGMTASSFLLADLDQRRLAWPHLRTPGMIANPIYPYHRGDAPSSFLHATITDICHWAVTCLNRGTYQGQRILTPSSFDLMWTPVARRDYPPFREEMGLGWNLGHFEGAKTIGHGGGGFGWTGFFVLLPEENRGAIILCNEESSAHDCILQAVLRTMLGLEPQVGSVSWMVPIAQALQAGGIQAATARYTELKDSDRGEYFFDEYELITLIPQMMGVGKIDEAIDVLNLNTLAFPEDPGSYFRLAELYLRKDERALAETAVLKVLSIRPESIYAAKLLEKIRQH